MNCTIEHNFMNIDLTDVGTTLILDDLFFIQMLEMPIIICEEEERKMYQITSTNRPFVLTPNIEDIKFSDSFNCPFEMNKYIKSLTFGENFNLPLVLSKYVVDLLLGRYFNQPIQLTKYLEMVRIEKHFNQLVKLPKSTRIFESFSPRPNIRIILSKNIRRLCFDTDIYLNIEFPKYLTKLTIDGIFPKNSFVVNQYMRELDCGYDTKSKCIFREPLNSDLSVCVEMTSYDIFENLPNGLSKIVVDIPNKCEKSHKSNMPNDVGRSSIRKDWYTRIQS